MRDMAFIDFGIYHWTAPLQKLYSMTLNYFFKINYLKSSNIMKRWVANKCIIWLSQILIFAMKWCHYDSSIQVALIYFFKVESFGCYYLGNGELVQIVSYRFYRFAFLVLNSAISTVVLHDLDLLFKVKYANLLEMVRAGTKI